MRWFKIVAVGLVLTGCGASDTANPTAPAASSPTTASAPTVAPTTASQPATAPAGPATGSVVEQRAVAELAQHLSLTASDVTVTDVERIDWTSSGLGCESSDQMYLMVITPGARVTLMAGGKSYDVHTNEDGSQLVLCQEGKPTLLGGPGGGSGGQSSQLPPTLAPTSTAPVVTPPPSRPATAPPAPQPQATAVPLPKATAAPRPKATAPPAPQPKATARPAPPATRQPAPTSVPNPPATEAPVNTPSIADQVLAKHAQDFGVARSALAVVSVEARDWSSSGLGCEKPGEMYLTVMTSGYIVVIEQAGTRYNYHTNTPGTRIVLCEQ